MTNGNKAPFQGPQSWAEKTFEADAIWAQVKQALAQVGMELPQTPRRPDIRLIVNNTGPQAVTFRNPGDHSGSKPENVPGTGDKTAAMVMLAGDTLADQQLHAYELVKRFNLGEEGLSPAFVSFLGTPEAREYIEEAYGPAPYEGQAQKLVPVDWKTYKGKDITIKPVFGTACAYGARAPAEETAFLATMHVYVKGTTTTPELMENNGMVIAVAVDWQTQQESTRPIVPSVAQEFYGEHFYSMPKVIVDTEGRVQSIDLGDREIAIDPANGAARLVAGAATSSPAPRP